LEQLDIHNGYGHLYVQLNEPAIAPLGESKPNTEFFRLLAREMKLDMTLFETTDEELARVALQPTSDPNNYPTASAFDGITYERLQREGAVRLNLPTDYAPFATGQFGTPSGKCEFFSERLMKAGHDPLPGYTPPHEDPQTKPELAMHFPLQMITPPEPAFCCSTFGNVPALIDQAKEPTVHIHAQDALKRMVVQDQAVKVFNNRGEFYAKAVVGETVPPGTVAVFGFRWSREQAGKPNGNTLTSTNLTDFGGGATFFDNLVEVTV
jgi:anaerobic selenocysteine-containing dehydrogenase